MTDVNQVLPITALLRPTMPAVYNRNMIYDPTWNDPSYGDYETKIVPQPWSVVHNPDSTMLWVSAIDPVTFYPTYIAIPDSTIDDGVTSLLDYGNSLLRLYIDDRALPYPVAVDSKCVFLGKSPRFYTLVRYPGTANETIISQYYDQTGTLASNQVPVKPTDSTNTAWYLPRCYVSVDLTTNEEVRAQIYNEDGTEVYSALLIVKTSAVINENVLYQPRIESMTATALQTLSNGNFFVYEDQDIDSLGITVRLTYSDGTTKNVQVDYSKCFIYGQSDFISSYAGMTQNLIVKYFRSESEAINPAIADATGEMITIEVPVTVVPNSLGVTTKIVPLPTYNTTTARYVMYYWMYFGDGSSNINVSAYVNIASGSLVTDSTYFGTTQAYTITVDMNQVDPVRYPTSVIYTQTIAITFNAPTSLVRYSFADSKTSLYIYGLDNSQTRRPVFKYDSTLHQYFVPTTVFANEAAFLKSFYTMASPPFDPTTSSMAQTPTHFVVRSLMSDVMIVSAPIPMANYDLAFNLIEGSPGSYSSGVVIFEFLNVVSSSVTNVLFGVPVDCSTGTYIAPTA